MACATCGSSTRRSSRQQANQQSPASSTHFRATTLAEGEDTILVEFTGSGSRTITRTVTGATYRFGSDRGHRVRRVRRSDLPSILNQANFRPAPTAPEAELVEPTTSAEMAEQAEPTRGRGRPRRSGADVEDPTEENEDDA